MRGRCPFSEPLRLLPLSFSFSLSLPASLSPLSLQLFLLSFFLFLPLLIHWLQCLLAPVITAKWILCHVILSDSIQFHSLYINECYIILVVRQFNAIYYTIYTLISRPISKLYWRRLDSTTAPLSLYVSFSRLLLPLSLYLFFNCFQANLSTVELMTELSAARYQASKQHLFLGTCHHFPSDYFQTQSSFSLNTFGRFPYSFLFFSAPLLPITFPFTFTLLTGFNYRWIHLVHNPDPRSWFRLQYPPLPLPLNPLVPLPLPLPLPLLLLPHLLPLPLPLPLLLLLLHPPNNQR